MACTYVLNTEQYGEVEIWESLNCRRITLRISKIDGRLRVSCPRKTQPKTVVEFLNASAEWIRKNRAAIEKKESPMTIFTEDTHFETRFHRLCIRKSTRKRVHVNVSPSKGSEKGVISIEYPEAEDVTTEQMQQLIHRCIGFALKVEASEYLPQKVKSIAERIGAKYTSLKFKDMTSRWGSCSSKGEICLNVHLMRLPEALINLVITHELCHTFEMNHSKRFHELVNRYCNGQESLLEKELKKHSTNRF
ncbi:MAG: M48 family metallopeptidase [Bacteroidales bacterium]|nr:M48 family metallopeptidase [Bacteroidales bacterium]MCR5695909.1 M48 family metallopeptidase [Marinilabiliaceae bacterium]